MFRSLFVLLFVFLGCKPDAFISGTPQAADMRSSFREAIENGTVDVDIYDANRQLEIPEEELFDIGVTPSVEGLYNYFADNGNLEADDGDALARSASPCVSATERGKLVSVELIVLRSKNGIVRESDKWVNGPANGGYVFPTSDLDPYNFAHIWAVKYCTIDFDGSPALASGAVGVPGIGWGQEVDTVMYSHGTAVYRQDAPSIWGLDTYEGIPAMLSLVAGYDATNVRGDLTLSADGTGFGDSSIWRHRYFNKTTQVATTIDLKKAVDDSFVPALLINRSDKTYAAGFSQGGNIAVQTAESLQLAGTPVDGVITLAGAIAVEDIVVNYYSTLDDPGSMGVIVYLASSAYDTGHLPGWTVDEIFLAGETVYGANDMTHTYAEAGGILYYAGASSFETTFTQAFLDEQMFNPASEFRTWLASTDASAGWCPSMPVRMIFDPNDPVVVDSYALGWGTRWQSACPTSDIQMVSYTTGVFGPPAHDQLWFSRLYGPVGLGADFNALP